MAGYTQPMNTVPPPLVEHPPLPPSPALRERGSTPPRASGEIRASFDAHGSRTRIGRLYETGGLRLRFPKSADMCEAVVVNTAGGIVGGDSARLAFEAGAGAHVALTTQSAEKIYRSDGAQARMDVSLTLRENSTLDWLPQEAILFDQAFFTRNLRVDMAASAQLMLCESVVFGRLAMGEQCRRGAFGDRWRIFHGGKLIFGCGYLGFRVRGAGSPRATMSMPRRRCA